MWHSCALLCFLDVAALPAGSIFNESGTRVAEAFPDPSLLQQCRDRAVLLRALEVSIRGWGAAERLADECQVALRHFQDLAPVSNSLENVRTLLERAVRDVQNYAEYAARLRSGDLAASAPQRPSEATGSEGGALPTIVAAKRIQGSSWLYQAYGSIWACEDPIQIFLFDVKVGGIAM